MNPRFRVYSEGRVGFKIMVLLGEEGWGFEYPGTIFDSYEEAVTRLNSMLGPLRYDSATDTYYSKRYYRRNLSLGE